MTTLYAGRVHGPSTSTTTRPTARAATPMPVVRKSRFGVRAAALALLALLGLGPAPALTCGMGQPSSGI